VLAEHDLGVTIDLINSDAYSIDPDAVLDPIDEKLLEEEVSTPQDANRLFFRPCLVNFVAFFLHVIII